MNKVTGKFTERPEGAAPLFDTEVGRAAANKRWTEYRKLSPKEKLRPKFNFEKDVEFGIVYFVEAAANGRSLVKIGVTKNLEERFAALQQGSPIYLKMGFGVIIPRPEAMERALHEAFKDNRVKGEWFDVTLGEAMKKLAELF